MPSFLLLSFPGTEFLAARKVFAGVKIGRKWKYPKFVVRSVSRSRACRLPKFGQHFFYCNFVSLLLGTVFQRFRYSVQPSTLPAALGLPESSLHFFSLSLSLFLFRFLSWEISLRKEKVPTSIANKGIVVPPNSAVLRQLLELEWWNHSIIGCWLSERYRNGRYPLIS